MASATALGPNQKTIFGHPTGLFVLFFAEMWERFSYYGMRALLVFYMIKDFLSYEDGDAYTVYGAYTALVYMTPFFGGMIADRLIGPKRAVILGGLLMAAGHLVMTFRWEPAFFSALALLIMGNGFFKPNISTMVGDMYGENDPRRDGGFTLFYMGINLGAAMAPLLCGYIGETYGWHYGFGLATVGMLVGLGIFVIPGAISKWIVSSGAVVTALGMVLLQDNWLLLAVNGFVAIALAVAGVIAWVAMTREPLPPELGGPKDPAKMTRKVLGPITAEWLVYIGAVLIVPLVAALVYVNLTVAIIPTEYLEALQHSDSTLTSLSGTLLEEISRPAGLLLTVIGLGAVAYLLFEAFRSHRIERERLFVILVLMFFSMLFWAFFEQAGSSVNNFTDRNIDRVNEERVLTAADIGQELTFEVNQEQLGFIGPSGKVFTMDQLDGLRSDRNEGEEGAEPLGFTEAIAAAFSEPPPVYRLLFGGAEDETDNPLVQTWKIDERHVGMGIGGSEVPASTFLSANPIYILLFGLVFTALWNFLGKRNLDPSTPVKFSLGLLQLGLGFGALWYGAYLCDDRGMVAMVWLLLAYLLHTTGELCLSPVGLSMVTKLSPAKLVSTAMGAWFLATALSNYLAAIIASFTGVEHGGGGEGTIPPPIETVNLYGDVYFQIAIAAIISAVVLFAMSPLLNRWMHEGVHLGSDGEPEGGGEPEASA